MAQTADQALTLTSGLFSSFLCNLRKVSSHLQLSPCGGIHDLVSCYRNISTSLWPLSTLGPFHLKIHLFPRKQREWPHPSGGTPPAHSLGNFPIIDPLCPETCPIQSMEFCRPEYWSGKLFPSPGDLPNPGLLHCRWTLYQLSHKGSPWVRKLWPKIINSSTSTENWGKYKNLIAYFKRKFILFFFEIWGLNLFGSSHGVPSLMTAD